MTIVAMDEGSVTSVMKVNEFRLAYLVYMEDRRREMYGDNYRDRHGGNVFFNDNNRNDHIFINDSGRNDHVFINDGSRNDHVFINDNSRDEHVFIHDNGNSGERFFIEDDRRS